MSHEQERKRGPDPKRVKIDREDWEDAVGDALKKKRPPGPEGWPKPEKPQKPSKND